MSSNRKDIITGFIIIVLIIAGVYLFKYLKKEKTIQVTPSPASYEFKKDFSDSFKINIPDNVNAIELNDISGGDTRGIATENEVLVDANDPENSYFYEAWLEKDGKQVSLGKLQMAKGGWLLSYDKSKYVGYKKIIISLEKTNDNKIEKRILEGSFN